MSNSPSEPPAITHKSRFVANFYSNDLYAAILNMSLGMDTQAIANGKISHLRSKSMTIEGQS
jgi:hypothetical protein